VNNTNAGGIVSCVDNGSYNSGLSPQLLITRSITIDCTGTVDHLRTTNGGVAIRIDAPDASVKLRGLMVDGAGMGSVGIDSVAGLVLLIQDCRIANFRSGFGIGIRFSPPTGASTKLHVSETVVNDNGTAASGGAIIVQPNGTGRAQVFLNRVRAENNTFGFLANGAMSTDFVSAYIRDSVITDNAFSGVSALTAAGGAPTSIVVDRSASTLNGTTGINAQGLGGSVVLAQSTVMSNVTGLGVGVSGGRILSYQNNQITGNVSDGGPTGVLTRR
jgi:hypothetical protein